ncbi:MAG: ABC transporter substrate-binding protein [Pseudomonadota bacterium]
MRRMLVMGLAAFAGLAGWASPAGAGLFSTTGPVIAILAGDLFLGEAEDNPDGSGTIRIQSRAKPDVSCRGQFTSSAELGGAGNMRCSDGATATFQFQRLSLVRGYGAGSSSRGSMSFTYGLSANESGPYLKLPPGKALRLDGKDLVLVDVRQPVPANLPVTGPIAPAPEAAPDVLLSAATLAVTAILKQDKNLQTNSPGKIAELVESTILPLFDFRHMTQLAVARNWRLASPEQQNTLIAEFRTLLVRTHSTALANYRDQAIEYRPLRIAPGETEVTVKSTVKQSGAERMTIDYDMEKTTAGWRVYDIKIAGISLITTYQSTFAKTIRDDGVDGLIQSLSAKNRQADSGLTSHESGARAVLFMYAVIPSVFRGRR